MTLIYDVAVIGGGIAGFSAAYFLAERASVIVLETEAHPGMHATGRSAAIFIAGYGSDTIRELSRQSRPFLERPPEVFGEGSLLSPRGIMIVAGDGEITQLKACAEDLQRISPHARWIDAGTACRLNPLLRESALCGAVFDRSAADIDVDRLCQGFLKGVRKAGGDIGFSRAVISMTLEKNVWHIDTTQGEIRARKILNAAGAWAGKIAEMAGGANRGLQAFRRSAAIVPPPASIDVSVCPMVMDLMERFYFKPEAGKLLVSPAEEVPVEPHDAYADDLDLAYGIHRAQDFLTFEINRVERSWAGLRTFAPGREPMIGLDPHVPFFYWSAGQGGYGVQTAPAWGAEVAKRVLSET